MENQNYKYLENYLDELQSSGKISFSWVELKQHFSGRSDNSLKLALHRQVKKGKLVAFYKGFYLIIPPEYRKRKILPLELFVDRLFRFLDREYYVGLLSAAAYYGASHHAIMESFAFIQKPPMRRSEAEGLRVNYLVKSVFPESGIIKRKSDAGYFNISSPELTAIDLVAYYKQAGGMNRVAEVLFELGEEMDAARMQKTLNDSFSLAVLQRLGYLFDEVTGRGELAGAVYEFLADKNVFQVKLVSDISGSHSKVNQKWKIIENYSIELELA
ncbi:MAG: hypothetical protein AMXMBFR48_29110 [Ignavibacteriales bacterium]